jgi:hypothetical protein
MRSRGAKAQPDTPFDYQQRAGIVFFNMSGSITNNQAGCRFSYTTDRSRKAETAAAEQACNSRSDLVPEVM